MNSYMILGFKMSGNLPNEEVTDEIVTAKYLKIKKMLEDLIEKRKYSKPESITRLYESMSELESAYEQLNTEEKRSIYNEPFLKELQLKTTFGRLIASEGGNPLEKPIKKEINKQNRAANVRKNPSYIEYTPEYEDDKVILLGVEDIEFYNGNMYKDGIKKYMLIIKKQEHLPEEVLSFYSQQDMDMSDNDHRKALYQAIKRAYDESNKNEEKYIGNIYKNENGQYTEIRDGGHIDAMKQREIQKQNERRNKLSKIQTQGEGR